MRSNAETTLLRAERRWLLTEIVPLFYILSFLLFANNIRRRNVPLSLTINLIYPQVVQLIILLPSPPPPLTMGSGRDPVRRLVSTSQTVRSISTSICPRQSSPVNGEL